MVVVWLGSRHALQALGTLALLFRARQALALRRRSRLMSVRVSDRKTSDTSRDGEAGKE
jgi:hypothetical protein